MTPTPSCYTTIRRVAAEMPLPVCDPVRTDLHVLEGTHCSLPIPSRSINVQYLEPAIILALVLSASIGLLTY